MSAGHEAEALMLQQYQASCRRIPTCVDELRATLAICEGKSPAPTQTARMSGTLQASLTQRRAQLDRSASPLNQVLNRPLALDVSGASPVASSADPAAVVAACKAPLSAVVAKYADQPIGGGTPPPASRPAPTTPPTMTLRPLPSATPTMTLRPLPSAPTTDSPRTVTSPLNTNPRAPLSIQLAPRAITLTQPSFEPGTDRMGSDYRGFALVQPDPQLCRRACEGDAHCKAFTFVREGLKGPQAMCFLKNAIPAPRRDDCCTSGAKPQ
jgi:hypothetical protein